MVKDGGPRYVFENNCLNAIKCLKLDGVLSQKKTELTLVVLLTKDDFIRNKW